MKPEEKQAKLNQELLDAAENGNIAEVERLIVAGAMVDAVNEYGQTPLHLAAWNGHTDIVSALIVVRADVNAVDEDVQTPLHLAAINGHTAIVESLLKAGADVNAKDAGGKTPLHLTAWNGHTDTVNALLAGKANVNAQDTYGQTPLHLAAKYGGSKTLEALIIAKGADLNIKDNEGKTALDIAKDVSDTFYNKFIDVLANLINETSKAETFAMGNHPRLGQGSLLHSLDTYLIKEIVNKAAPARMTLGNIPEGLHHKAVEKQLEELQKNVGPHASKVTKERSGTPPPPSRG